MIDFFFKKVYIAEIVPARLRGTLGSINQQAITLGLLLCCVMGAFVDWRWLAIIGAMPSVFLIIFMLAMPETPRWCLGKNRRTEALAALRWLRGPEADVDQECFTIQETLGEKSSLLLRSYYLWLKGKTVNLQWTPTIFAKTQNSDVNKLRYRITNIPYQWLLI